MKLVVPSKYINKEGQNTITNNVNGLKVGLMAYKLMFNGMQIMMLCVMMFMRNVMMLCGPFQVEGVSVLLYIFASRYLIKQR